MDNPFIKQTKPSMTQMVSVIAMLVFLPMMLLATSEIVQLLTKASGTPANIVINTKIELEPLDFSFYHAFAQGGEEGVGMLKPVVNQIKALKPQVVRLDHIYDHFDVVKKSGDQLSYDWSKLDEEVNTILEMGAKPLLALSYMPAAIAKDGVIINQPSNWNDWASVVQATIERYSGKGSKNLSGLYYEVWNEPDLAQFGGWKYGGEKSYITLYQYASMGAKRAQNVNTFYLGGPGTTGLYKSWILALVNSGARVDFLSWHTYQRDPAKYDTDQRDIASWLLPYPYYSLAPKLITEFGFTGDKSPAYGTTYAAAHAAAVIRQLLSNGVTYAFSFQPKDGPNQQSGNGWGLITHQDNSLRKKPRYDIYPFIDSCDGKRVSLSGEGSWVTGFASVKSSKYCVILINFDVNGTHSEAVPITIGGLDNGSYTVRQKFFLGSDTSLTETVTNGSIQKKILMPASSILQLEISKK